MSSSYIVDQTKVAKRKKAIKLCLLLSDSNSWKAAFRFLKAFLIPALDEVHLATAINSESGRNAAITRQQEVAEAEMISDAKFHVVIKEDEYTLFESLGRYLSSAVKPDIIFMGSTNLCTGVTQPPPPARSNIVPASPSNQPPRRAASGAIQGGGSSSGAANNGNGVNAAGASLININGINRLGGSCVALKILAEVRCAPVLLVKYNSKGAWLTAAAGGGGGGNGTPTVSPGGSFRINGRIPGAALSSSGATESSRPVGRTSVYGGSNGGGGSMGGGIGGGTSSTGGGGGGSSISVGGGIGVGGSHGGAGRPPTSNLMSRSSSLAGASLGGAPANNSGGMPMRVMVDLQPNSRHVLDWLFEHLSAGRDHLVLAVSQAYDDQHNVKPLAQRLLTAFGVQAAVNSFEAERAVLSGPSNKSLPGAVMESEPDLLVLQAPRCKGLPPSIVEVLFAAKTSFLIWPPDFKVAPA